MSIKASLLMLMLRLNITMNKNSIIPLAAYVAVAMLILGPGLLSGYLFLIDMPWPFKFEFSHLFQGDLRPHLPLVAVFTLLNTIIPSWVIQKILLISIITFAGFNTRNLSKSLTNNNHIAFSSGLIAILNPFLAERLVAGQWIVLAGYAYAPLVIHLLLNALINNKQKSYVYFIIAYSLFPIISLHWWYMTTPILLLIAIIYILKYRTKYKPMNIAKISVLGIASFLIINSFWMYSVAGPDGSLSQINDTVDFYIFRPNIEEYGLHPTIMSLYGFWNDRIASPKDYFSFWYIVGIAMFLSAIYGILISQKSDNPKLKIFSTTALLSLPIAYLLSLGIGEPITRSIINSLMNLPGFVGMRETGKFIGLLAIFVAIFAPIAVAYRTTTQKTQTISLFAITIAIIISMNGLLLGARGQLKPYDYPSSYIEIKDDIDRIDTKILVLPRAGYLDLKFAGNSYAANPSRVNYGNKLDISSITGNPIIDGEYDLIDEISLKYYDKNLRSKIQKLGYEYVLVLKTDSWSNYEQFISTLDVIYDSKDIALYKL